MKPNQYPTVSRPNRSSVRQMIQSYGSDDAVIDAAIDILKGRVWKCRDVMSDPGLVKNYLRLNLATLDYESFWCVFLDAQNRVIAMSEMFRGTITQTSVYPREIVKQALAHNAAGVILAHNHPSGTSSPSAADEAITRHLKQALAMVDVRVIDHFVVTSHEVTSFAEKGLL